MRHQCQIWHSSLGMHYEHCLAHWPLRLWLVRERHIILSMFLCIVYRLHNLFLVPHFWGAERLDCQIAFWGNLRALDCDWCNARFRLVGPSAESTHFALWWPLPHPAPAVPPPECAVSSSGLDGKSTRNQNTTGHEWHIAFHRWFGWMHLALSTVLTVLMQHRHSLRICKMPSSSLHAWY